MRVILDLSGESCICGLTQFTKSPEGFQHLKEEHPEDTFIVANMFSQIFLDEFIELLAFLGWTADEWWIATSYEKQNFLPVQDEKNEIFDEMVEQYLEKMADEWELSHCH